MCVCSPPSWDKRHCCCKDCLGASCKSQAPGSLQSGSLALPQHTPLQNSTAVGTHKLRGPNYLAKKRNTIHSDTLCILSKSSSLLHLLSIYLFIWLLSLNVVHYFLNHLLSLFGWSSILFLIFSCSPSPNQPLACYSLTRHLSISSSFSTSGRLFCSLSLSPYLISAFRCLSMFPSFSRSLPLSPHFWSFFVFICCWNHYVYSVFSNKCLFKPAHPPKIGTLF